MKKSISSGVSIHKEIDNLMKEVSEVNEAVSQEKYGSIAHRLLKDKYMEMQTELHSAQNKKYVIHVEEIF